LRPGSPKAATASQAAESLKLPDRLLFGHVPVFHDLRDQPLLSLSPLWARDMFVFFAGKDSITR
jgi:hypothetical protein